MLVYKSAKRSFSRAANYFVCVDSDFAPKNERKYFCISALAPKKKSNQKNKGTCPKHVNNQLVYKSSKRSFSSAANYFVCVDSNFAQKFENMRSIIISSEKSQI